MATFDTLKFSERVPEPVLSRERGADSEDESASELDSNLSDDGLANSEDEMESGEEDSGSIPEGGVVSNPGWADAMAKILKTNKPKGKKSIVLAKAKKLNDVIKKDKTAGPGFEIVGEVKEEKPDKDRLDVKPGVDVKPTNLRIKRLEWYSIGRQKPHILDKDRERSLAKIGTKGVVQLFNAVSQQQKFIDSKMQDAGLGPAKRDKILKTIDKKAFLDVVMGAADSQPLHNPVKDESDAKEESQPLTWQVLRDDFMMGGKYKDWDRDAPKEEEDAAPMEEDSDTDSD